MSLFAELRRRNVIRIAGLYVVSAWLLVQIADTLLPIFHTPDWVLQAVVVLLALGFVPALIFSWVFELTPQGLKRESELDPARSHVDPMARKLDVAVIALLLVVAVLVVWRPGAAPTAPASESVSGQAENSEAPDADVIVDKSIAVLPFADFSQDGDQSWFSDGLTEEILNALARTPDLLVAARTSSFKYKGSTLAIPQIAAELGVAHVLEGSVRGSGERIRVTAQLIRAADGFHLWSQTYDRDRSDVISIQENLAQQIATAMQTSMDPEALADMAQVGTRSVEAYQAYLEGIANRSAGLEGVRRAYEAFERARTFDPKFGAAHARAAGILLVQLEPSRTSSGVLGLSVEALNQGFTERNELAIQHAASETDRLQYRAQRAIRSLRLSEAIDLLRALTVERPADIDVWGQLAFAALRASDYDTVRHVLDETRPLALKNPGIAQMHLNTAHRVGDVQQAADQVLEIMQRWPDQPDVLYQTHRALLWAGRVDAARSVLERWQSLVSDQNAWSVLPPARQDCAEGRRAAVEQALSQLAADDYSRRWHLLMLLGEPAKASETLQPLERAGNTYALSGFLSYPQFDPRPFPSLMKVLEREHIERPSPIPLPFACAPAGSGP